MAATPPVVTPPTAGTPVEMGFPKAPLAYKPPDVKTLNPIDIAKTAKVVENKPVQPVAETVAGDSALPGTTVEVTKTADLEKLNDPDDIKKALTESARVLLAIKSPILGLVAEAAACGNTPMGLELQYDVLDYLRHMPLRQQKLFDKVSLKIMQTRLNKLNFPKNPPVEAFSNFVLTHKDDLQDTMDPGRLALELNAGQLSPMDLVNRIKGDKKHQEFNRVKDAFFQAITGKSGKMNPIDMYAAVNIDFMKQQKNILQALDTSPRPGMDRMMAISIVLFASMMTVQMVTENSGTNQQRGHGG